MHPSAMAFAVSALTAEDVAGKAVIEAGASSALSWTNGSGGAWSIVSMDLTSSAGTRAWFGNFNGQPISVANGNTFQVAVGGITISLT